LEKIYCIVYKYTTSDDDDIEVIHCYRDKEIAENECKVLNSILRGKYPNGYYAGTYFISETVLHDWRE
jgi:hypothetical protein